MPRAAGQKEYLSLIKGLNTESSSLVFPEGFTADELNFVIDKDGLIRKRRLGFDDLVTPFVVTAGNPKIENVFYWRSPSLVCVVVTDDTPQTTLRFHAVDDDFTFIIQIVISDKEVVTQIAETTDYLMITTDNGDNPILCKYKESTKEIFVYDVSLYVRDFELVDDGLTISENPITLSDDHKYNLINAGWYLTRKDLEDAKTNKLLYTAYNDFVGNFPSNAQVPSVGIIIDETGDTVFSPKDVQGADFGSSKAPRGHYAYPITNFDRTDKLTNNLADGILNTTVTSVGTVDFSATPTYNPDDPTNDDNPSGGGRIPPYKSIGFL